MSEIDYKKIKSNFLTILIVTVLWLSPHILGLALDKGGEITGYILKAIVFSTISILLFRIWVKTKKTAFFILGFTVLTFIMGQSSIDLVFAKGQMGMFLYTLSIFPSIFFILTPLNIIYLDFSTGDIIKSGHSRLRPHLTPLILFSIFIIFYNMDLFLEYVFGEAGMSIWNIVASVSVLSFLFITFLFLLGFFVKTKSTFILKILIPVPFIIFFFCCVIFPDLFHGDTEGIIAMIGLAALTYWLLLIFPVAKKFPRTNLFGFWNRYLYELLETAALPIKNITNGYTERPYPAGKSKYKKEEIIKFAQYLNKNLIATSFIEKDKVILVFSGGHFMYIPKLKPNLQKVTHVNFDYRGNLSVFIAKKDYQKYKDELTFDELCNSLGNIILQFLEYFKQGEGERILEKIILKKDKK